MDCYVSLTDIYQHRNEYILLSIKGNTYVMHDLSLK